MHKYLKSINKLAKATDQTLMNGVSAVTWSVHLATGCTKSQLSSALCDIYAVGMSVGLSVSTVDDGLKWWIAVPISSSFFLFVTHKSQKVDTKTEAREIAALKDGRLDPKVEKAKTDGFNGYLGIAAGLGLLGANVFGYSLPACNFVLEIGEGLLVLALLSFGLSEHVMRTDYLPPQRGTLSVWIKNAFRRSSEKQAETNLESEQRK